MWSNFFIYVTLRVFFGPENSQLITGILYEFRRQKSGNLASVLSPVNHLYVLCFAAWTVTEIIFFFCLTEQFLCGLKPRVMQKCSVHA